MKLLITGGAGFIGSHLSTRLIEIGHSVIALDNLSTGSAENIAGVMGNSSFEFVQGSMLDEKLIETLMAKVDGCMHLGAALGVQRILERPYESLVANTHGSEIAIKAAAELGKRFFLASTSELYGKNPKQPLTEESDRVIGSPQLVRWAYSEAKAIDESIVQMFHMSHSLNFVTGRFFNTVGPRQSGAYGMVLPRFVSAAIKNEPITIYGDGSQSRVFCHVSDAVNAVLKIFFEDKALGNAFNIGGKEEISITDLAKRVITLTNSTSKIEYLPYSKAYPAGFEETMRRVPDTSKIGSMTGWKPEFSLDEIIKDIEKFIRTSS
ncbi:MAG: NAD-dependent epimerase/dehydratase family protein [Actinobacteria bacterium]|nr:NAD-dependent epimerase/dehydratase family protein [Actinomycetota bacterium]